MTSSTQYAQAYQQAVSAYINGNYEEAVTITDYLVKNYPNDPNLRLLQGHVYCCLQHYDVAREQYQTVLESTSDPELIECTNNSLRDINQLGSVREAGTPETSSFTETYVATSEDLTSSVQELEAKNLETARNFDFNSFDVNRMDSVDELNQSESDLVFIDPFSSGLAASPDVEESTPINDSLSDTTPSKGAELDSSLGSAPNGTGTLSLHRDTQAPVDFFDDLGKLPDFNLIELTNQPDSEQGFIPDVETSTPRPDHQPTAPLVQNLEKLLEPAEGQPSTGVLIASTEADSQQEAQPKFKQGVFTLLENTSKTKQLLAASATGIVSALAVIVVSQVSPKTTVQQENAALSRLVESGLVAVVAGIAGGTTTFALRQRTARQIKRATDDLQMQFNAVLQRDFSAQAIVHSQDELGQLTTSSNQVTYVMDKTTGEAKQKADE